MLGVAEIFRLHGPEYRAKFADRMLPSHRRAISNMTHRGKAVVRDFEIVKSSLKELYEIFVRVKEKVFNPENSIY